ncbi:MAG: glycosyltransferase family 2 protein [Verrucomicrobia bacterium]|nr:glycosyltransferase family 2 protein [Verrucomicrobiota bacterium]
MVSFLIPCYNYAHYLGECLSSILCQTYKNFEVLVLDDHSPDNTPEVARSFGDSRVIHIRNERNLGLFANVTKGFELVKGDHVWLISADDRLNNPRGLERYMRFVEQHPQVGYVFSPVIAIRDGKTDAVPLDYTVLWDQNRLIKAPEMGFAVLDGCQGGPSVLYKKSALKEVGIYQPELPRTSDWYGLGAIGMAHDVGYIAEPVANVRYHSENMDGQWSANAPDYCRDQDLGALNMLRRRAEQLGLWTLAYAYQAQIPKALVRHGRGAYDRGHLDAAERSFRMALASGGQNRRAYMGLLRVSFSRAFRNATSSTNSTDRHTK